jgi:hypothetical protein
MTLLTSFAHICCYEKEATTDNGKLKETEILILRTTVSAKKEKSENGGIFASEFFPTCSP